MDEAVAAGGGELLLLRRVPRHAEHVVVRLHRDEPLGAALQLEVGVVAPVGAAAVLLHLAQVPDLSPT